METIAKTRTLGGSLIVTIPKNIVDEQNIHPNELIRLEINKRKKSYRGCCKGIGHLTAEDKWDIK
jgi:hypothetical protein|tara:strand:- start:549 stop:743 length:195 start_codon:yes stop_codon:yes gene_type:complete